MVDAIVSFFKHEDKLNEAELLRIKSEKAMTQYDLGCVFQERGKLPEAIYCYQKCIKYHPNHIEAHYNLGISLHELNLLRDAEKHYKLILKLDPKHGPTLYNLGYLYQDLGFFDKAIRLFQESLWILPNDIDVLINLGICFRHIKKYNSALDTFCLVIELEPENCMGILNLGMVYHQMKEFEQAILCFDRIIANDKNNISAWFNLAVAYQDKAAYTLYEEGQFDGNDNVIGEMMSKENQHHKQSINGISFPLQTITISNKTEENNKNKTSGTINSINSHSIHNNETNKYHKSCLNVTQQLALLSREKLLVVLTDFQMALKSYETVCNISLKSKSKMKTYMYRDSKIASNFIENKLCEFHSKFHSNNMASNNSVIDCSNNIINNKVSSRNIVDENSNSNSNSAAVYRNGNLDTKESSLL